ncbi:MAG TPA: RNA polymerase sigma factor [Stellaceae bacterium]|nr:RNA polymerase sigma factor [Stellaceae bacterium]
MEGFGGRLEAMEGFGGMLAAQIPRLRRYARVLCRDPERADELVQDCLYRAIRKAHLFQPGSNLRAWLFTILHNLYVNAVRRGARESINVPLEDVEPVLMERPAQGGGLTLRDLGRAMTTLREEQRQVLLLVGLEGMSYDEVASILGVPVGTVRSRLSRGREELRHMLDGEAPLPRSRVLPRDGMPTSGDKCAQIKRWRLRAEEIRTSAEQFTDPAARRSLEAAAANYERVAARTEIQLSSTPLRAHSHAR